MAMGPPSASRVAAPRPPGRCGHPTVVPDRGRIVTSGHALVRTAHDRVAPWLGRHARRDREDEVRAQISNETRGRVNTDRRRVIPRVPDEHHTRTLYGRARTDQGAGTAPQSSTKPSPRSVDGVISRSSILTLRFGSRVPARRCRRLTPPPSVTCSRGGRSRTRLPSRHHPLRRDRCAG
jgi:hypothetical protein